eukprot:CAMPEP_0204264812 /NCGR_PEP_ID=MMETSP0468-20130131/9255_1 /ASSEMBLY_ACC=CAM_ASM_000383 /TAXON_ID=2969 /ORGANISM="Oxyrrhis marina" /LENGTH=42 /DNA_ID= /DNA_START= /DNA_END= /DNA_ORIENTATION=
MRRNTEPVAGPPGMIAVQKTVLINDALFRDRAQSKLGHNGAR